MLAMWKRIGDTGGNTWVLVVADGEVRRDEAANVGKTLGGAVGGGAANMGGTLPDDLGEVAPLLEVGHVGVGMSVQILVPANLAVVEQIGDDGGDVARWNTRSDVLAVPATIHLAI